MSLNNIGFIFLFVMLVALFLATFPAKGYRDVKYIVGWLCVGLGGILVGSAGSVVAIKALGYESFPVSGVIKPSGDQMDMIPTAESMAQTGPPVEGPGGGPGDAGPGGGGPGGGGQGGGGFTPPPKFLLVRFVRKVGLLMEDAEFQLSAEQTGKLGELLGKIKPDESMTDEDATALHDSLLVVLDETQREKFDNVTLPRQGRRGSGGSGRPGRPPGPGAGERPDPLTQEQNVASLNALMKQLSADEATPKVNEGTPKVNEETPKVNEETPKVDEGTPKVDEGTPKVDEGTPKVDEGTPKVDEGTPKVDEGTPKN